MKPVPPCGAPPGDLNPAGPRPTPRGNVKIPDASAALSAADHRRRGFWYALAGSFSVSTNFVTAKHALVGFDVITFSFLWPALAAVWTLGLILLRGQGRELRLPRRAVGPVALMGAATGAGMLLGWAGLARLDPTFQAFLWRFVPVLTLGLGVVFLKERFEGRELMPVAIMIGGSFICVAGRWQAVGSGTILTLLACLCIGLQMFLGKVSVGAVDPLILVFYRAAIAAAGVGLFGWLGVGLDCRAGLSHWLSLGLGSFLGPFLGYLLYFKSYQYWELSRSSVIQAIQPLFVFGLAYVFLGQVPHGREALGGLIILAGALWLSWLHSRISSPE